MVVLTVFYHNLNSMAYNQQAIGLSEAGLFPRLYYGKLLWLVQRKLVKYKIERSLAQNLCALNRTKGQSQVNAVNF